MTATEVYDLLLKAGLAEPAVVQLGDRFVLGSWEETGEVRGGIILRSSKCAIVVMGEGHSLPEALESAKRSHPDLLWPGS